MWPIRAYKLGQEHKLPMVEAIQYEGCPCIKLEDL